MNAFYLLVGTPELRRPAGERVARSMLSQGFVEDFRFDDATVQLRAYIAPGSPSRHLFTSGDDFAVSVGPLWYRDEFGPRALELMYREEGSPASLDSDSMRGTFTVVIRKAGELIVFSDPLDLQRVYHGHDGRLITSSWLAAVESLERRTLDIGAGLQYVLFGAVHGEETPVTQIRSVAPGHFVDVRRLKQVRWQDPQRLLSGPGFSGRAQAVQTLSAHFRETLGRMANAVDGHVRMALSGGFDSRLILAGLMANGVRPDLFVYGAAADADVRIARSVASAERLPCKVVDKVTLERSMPPLDLDAMESACRFFDGLPVDGILDRGADRMTRLEQYQGGALALNGGGGEILRNFFHLPDRCFSAGDLVNTFYRGFDAAAVLDGESLRSMLSAMASSIRAAVGATATLSRQQVELAYPLFRCRYWMGRNNAVSSRWGLFATPLVDPVAVRLAVRLPLQWKAAGAFESKVIAHLHRGVAAHTSSYGFPFGGPPNLRTRFDEWSSCARPIWARPMIPALRRMVSRSSRGDTLLVTCRALLGRTWQVESILDIGRLGVDGALQRAATLEYLIRSRSIHGAG